MADLVLCRQLPIHLSLVDMRLLLVHVAASSAGLRLVSHFTERRENADIVSGDYHSVNLLAAPFRLPPHLEIIVEQGALAEGRLRDREPVLWQKETQARVLAGLRVSPLPIPPPDL